MEAITEIFGLGEAEQLINIAFEDALGISRIDRQTKNPELDETQTSIMADIQQRLLNQEPIQQIVGKAQFFGYEFLINQHCLIPRPETEELVQLIIKSTKEPSSILDIGTGSGCIPIALKKSLRESTISAIDISRDALDVARKNAEKLAVDIDFQLQDILIEGLEKKYTVIVSNPPYIPISDKKKMSKNVLEYEPEIALFVANEDPLIFYRRIAQLGRKHLLNNGQLYFEIHENYGQEVAALLSDLNYQTIEVHQDLNGKDRMISAKF
ncbi:MAG: peptide chain release factor N(5)-glutamine methyltransferase [Cyclobacteriaceae bacterium]